MVLSNEWEKDFGHISVELEKTTPRLSMIQPNKSEKIPPDSSLSSQQQESSHLSLSPVPMKGSTKQISVMPQSISMILHNVSKIREASHISTNEQHSSPEAWSAMPTFSDCSTLSGETIDPNGVVSTPRSAPTITQAPVRQTAAKTVQSEASSAFSSTTLLRESVPRTFVSLNVPNMSSTIESSTSEYLVGSGISNQQWSTTTSTMRNSPQMDMLSEGVHEVNPQPASSPPQERRTTPPPVQTPDDIEMTEQSNQVSNSNNEDGDDSDEWEVLDETLVYADCVGAVESDLMEPGKSVLLVDLDSENPLIQIGPAIFQGTYEDCLGTNLIFEKHPSNSENPYSSSANPKPTIEIFASRVKTSTRPTFSYFGKTAKNLNLNRVFLKPKE